MSRICTETHFYTHFMIGQVNLTQVDIINLLYKLMNKMETGYIAGFVIMRESVGLRLTSAVARIRDLYFRY